MMFYEPTVITDVKSEMLISSILSNYGRGTSGCYRVEDDEKRALCENREGFSHKLRESECRSKIRRDSFVGFLDASGAGTAVLFKKSIVPRLKSWIRKVVSEDEEGLKKENSAKPNIAEEVVVAAKATASDVAQATQEMLVTKTEEKRFFEELMNMLSVQANEMKVMSNTIHKLEAGKKLLVVSLVDMCFFCHDFRNYADFVFFWRSLGTYKVFRPYFVHCLLYLLYLSHRLPVMIVMESTSMN